MYHVLYLSSQMLFNLYVGQSGDGTLRLVGGPVSQTTPESWKSSTKPLLEESVQQT